MTTFTKTLSFAAAIAVTAAAFAATPADARGNGR